MNTSLAVLVYPYPCFCTIDFIIVLFTHYISITISNFTFSLSILVNILRALNLKQSVYGAPVLSTSDSTINLSLETMINDWIYLESHVLGMNGIPILAIGWSNLKFLLKTKGVLGLILVDVIYLIGWSDQLSHLTFNSAVFYLKKK